MLNTHSLVIGAGRHIVSLQKWILVVASSILIVDIFAEVLLRYVLHRPIFGTDELASLIAVWVYFFGAANATRTRTHIEGGFANVLIKKEYYKNLLRFIVLIITLIVGAVFTYLAYEWSVWTIINNVATTSLFFPTIYGEIAMLIGAILMMVYFGIEAVEIFKKLRKGTIRET